VAAVVAPGLVIFVYPMVSLLARNEEYFRGAYSAGRAVYLAGVATVAAGAVAWAASGTRVGRPLFTAYVLLTPAWLVYSLFGATRHAIGAVVAAVLLVLSVVYLTRRPRPLFLPRIGLFAAVIVVAMGATTALEVSQAGEGDVSGAEIADRETEGDPDLPNIYHVVLDEFQTEMFEAVLDDELREELAGFTWYPNAQTTWGRTEMSMAATLGHDEWDFESPAREYVEEALMAPSSSLQQLRELGYETTGYYQNPSLYVGDPGPFDHRYLASEVSTGGPRGEYRALAGSLWVYAHLPGIVAQRLIPETRYEQLDGQTLLPEDAPSLSVLNFERFLRREAALPATGRYELVHLILPHFPYVLSPYCEYEAGVETDPVVQSECAMLLMQELIDRLQRLGRFDESVVVIQGDHGAHFEALPDGSLGSLGGDTFSEAWSGARARPLLLVKPAGAGADGPLERSDYPALLTDIMPTVFDSIDADVPVADGRVSLLEEDLPARDARVYHFYEPGRGDLPDEEVQRYVIADGVVTTEERIPVP
jgi:hypothetical protein